jgi:L-rhamnose-H+ transport protein
MGSEIGFGIALALLGGALNGSFPAPMKRMSGWRWENSWLIFSLIGLILMPWVAALATVPHLTNVYHQTSWPVLVKVCVYGFAWGVGNVLVGVGISRVGMALGLSMILGITSSFGSLLPLAVLHPEQMFTHRGLGLIAGTLVMIVGLVFLSIAGRRREREQSSGQSSSVRSGFAVGLIICILSGIFSSMFNFAFVFGDKLKQNALDSGASSAMAGNAIWAVAVLAGFVANGAYCVYLLNKNHTWGVFLNREGGAGYWLGGALMGGLWFGGVFIYGMGAASLGVLGGMIGWPLFMTMAIVAGTFWGFVSGEWKGSSRTSYGYALTGIGILFLAIAVIAWGNAA